MENRWREGRNKRGGEATPQWEEVRDCPALPYLPARQGWLFPVNVGLKMASMKMLPKVRRIEANHEGKSRVC